MVLGPPQAFRNMNMNNPSTAESIPCYGRKNKAMARNAFEI